MLWLWKRFGQNFQHLPSAWLLLVQLLILALLTNGSPTYRALSWSVGVLALLIIAKVIRQTPIYTLLGLFFCDRGFFLFAADVVGLCDFTDSDYGPCV